MQPQVIGVTETKALDAAGHLVSVLNIRWKAGNFGPFTLTTNYTDLQNGTAMAKMQEIANSLAALPTATS